MGPTSSANSSLTIAPTILALAMTMGCTESTQLASYPDSFAGVGLVLTTVNQWPVVEKALEGGSAASAGVEAGDRIEWIDGRSTQGEGLGNVVAKIRGREGSQVTLGLRRDSQRVIIVVQRKKMVKSDDSRLYRAERDRLEPGR